MHECRDTNWCDGSCSNGYVQYKQLFYFTVFLFYALLHFFSREKLGQTLQERSSGLPDQIPKTAVVEVSL